MVVVASVGLIMTAVVGVILGSFRAENKGKSDSKVTENGSWIINEIRRNVFNSYSDETECSEDFLSVQIKSLIDGQITTLSCDQIGNEIASSSATRDSVLNNDEVEIVDCSNFVTCEGTDGEVSSLLFNFVLGAMTNGVGSSQVFSTRVTLRN